MKTRLATLISSVALAALSAATFPFQSIDESVSSLGERPNKVRYEVVFTETFGGPDGHIGIGGLHVLNNRGTLIGSADTSQPDPFAPDGCFNILIVSLRMRLYGEMAK